LIPSLNSGNRSLKRNSVSDTPLIPPLYFDPILKEKLWGGIALANVLNKHIPENCPVGESWELSGIAGNESVAATPPYTGKSLTQILDREKENLVGHFPNSGSFPLLYKFIDANERLSVQVHPTDCQAQSHGWGTFGKTECWYVVDAVPGARLVCGFLPNVTKKDVTAAAASANILGLLNYIDVSRGDVILVPGGTVHAILGGLLFYEVQETSDITFRLYDWNRLDRNGQSRPLHIPESIEAVDTTYHSYHKIKPIVYEKKAAFTHSFRAACRHFLLEEFRFKQSVELRLRPKKSFQVITVCGETAQLICGSSEMHLPKGTTVLIPACCQECHIAAQENTVVLISCVPDLEAEVVAPLILNDIPREDIVLLGGNPKTSDLAKLV
jgi:mannose-6-phosphate isomerase